MPIDPHITRTAVAAQHHVAEILELRPVGHRHIASLRRHHAGFGRSGIKEDLVRLMATDIDQDTAVARGIPEPGRTAWRIQPVRGKVDGLEHLADRARLDQLARADRCAHFERSE